MKNSEIIRECAVRVFGENFVAEQEKLGNEIPLHTLPQWKTKHENATLKPGAEGHDVLLWFVSNKTNKPYRKHVRLYEEKDIEY